MKRLALFLSLVLAACGGNSGETVFQGYVEGDFIAVAPEVGGRIVELTARRGSTVESGAVLFRLEDAEATASVSQAEAELARANAELTPRDVFDAARLTSVPLSERNILLANARRSLRRRLLFRRVARSALARRIRRRLLQGGIALLFLRHVLSVRTYRQR